MIRSMKRSGTPPQMKGVSAENTALLHRLSRAGDFRQTTRKPYRQTEWQHSIWPAGARAIEFRMFASSARSPTEPRNPTKSQPQLTETPAIADSTALS
jgi:hypothetical protein